MIISFLVFLVFLKSTFLVEIWIPEFSFSCINILISEDILSQSIVLFFWIEIKFDPKNIVFTKGRRNNSWINGKSLALGDFSNSKMILGIGLTIEIS